MANRGNYRSLSDDSPSSMDKEGAERWSERVSTVL